MEVAVLDFIWFTDKLKQIRMEAGVGGGVLGLGVERAASQVNILEPTFLSWISGFILPPSHIYCQLPRSISDNSCSTKKEK